MNTKIRNKIKLNTQWKDNEEFIEEKNPLINAQSSFDPKAIMREYYNGSRFDLLFISNGGHDFGQKYKLKRGDFLLLGHEYYVIYALEVSSSFDNPRFVPQGTPINGIIVNFGDSIGKGNKIPSKGSLLC